MRRLRIVLCLVVLVGALPVGVAGALALVEGDPDWDCTTMGNGECGPDGPALVEGDEGWDCASMGNGECGEATSLQVSPSAAALAPPYASAFEFTETCGQAIGYCEMEAEADGATGAFEVEATAVGQSCAANENGVCRPPHNTPGATSGVFFRASHELTEPAESVVYRATIDLREARSFSTLNFAVVTASMRARHLGCSTCGSPMASRSLDIPFPLGDAFLALEEVGVDLTAHQRGPVTLELVARHAQLADLPPGTIEVSIDIFARAQQGKVAGDVVSPGYATAEASADGMQLTAEVRPAA